MPVLSPVLHPSCDPIPIPTSYPDHALLFPEGDGEPLAESHEHVVSILDTFGVLKAWYKDDPTVHVGAINFVYYDVNNKTARPLRGEGPPCPVPGGLCSLVAWGADRRGDRVHFAFHPDRG